MGKLKKEVRDLDGLRFMMNMLKEVRQRESGISMEVYPIMNMYQVKNTHSKEREDGRRAWANDRASILPVSTFCGNVALLDNFNIVIILYYDSGIISHKTPFVLFCRNGLSPTTVRFKADAGTPPGELFHGKGRDRQQDCHPYQLEKTHQTGADLIPCHLINGLWRENDSQTVQYQTPLLLRMTLWYGSSVATRYLPPGQYEPDIDSLCLLRQFIYALFDRMIE